MHALPPILLLSGAVILGIILGLDYLRRERSKPAVIGFHFLMGAGSLETIAMMIRGAPDGAPTPAVATLKVAAALLAFALFTGLLAPMVGGGSRARMNATLLTHVSAAAGGVLLCIVWLFRIRG
jgi:hypothetical protein